MASSKLHRKDNLKFWNRNKLETRLLTGVSNSLYKGLTRTSTVVTMLYIKH